MDHYQTRARLLATGAGHDPDARGPNGAPIWCVDTSDESVARVPNPAVFVRWHKHAGTAPWKLVETATEREALALAKHPGLGLLARVIIAGDHYDIISDIIPF